MSIKLSDILKRNKSNLSIFITKNKLTSYQHLLDYCQRRNFIACSIEEYNLAVGIKKEKVKSKNAKKSSGSVSEAQKPKRRYRRKKKQATPKLPNSTD